MSFESTDFGVFVSSITSITLRKSDSYNNGQPAYVVHATKPPVDSR